MVGEQLDGLRREKVLAELNRTEKVLKTYVHVKGHQDNLDNEIVFGNNVADYLASYKNQNGYELDIPLKEEKKLKLYYFYDMDNDEVYADWVKRETHHVSKRILLTRYVSYGRKVRGTSISAIHSAT